MCQRREPLGTLGCAPGEIRKVIGSTVRGATGDRRQGQLRYSAGQRALVTDSWGREVGPSRWEARVARRPHDKFGKH